jgi:hypothetical protein
MFGNRLGWGIAAVLAMVIFAVVWKLTTLNAISPPSRGVVTRTGSVALDLPDNPKLLEAIELPFSPAAVFPGMTEAKDAGPLYRQAIERYQANKDPYDQLAESKGGAPRVTRYKELEALDLVVQARTANSMRLYAGSPEQVIGYTAYPPGLEALNRVGKAAIQLAMHVKDKNKEEALLLAEGAFSLGVKLAGERLRWYEFQTGVELMRDGAYLIKTLDPARGAASKEAEDQLRVMMKDQWVPMWTVISSIDPQVIGRTAGDVFYVAKNSKERMWRIEAVLKLGRYKYDVGQPGRGADQRWAGLTVKRMAEDQSLDYPLRVAAEAARDLTFERYNMIGGS